jgi:tRNA pseudouridine55 synthase
MKLGETTDTQDAYGKVIDKRPLTDIDSNLMTKTLKEFQGNILQKPPMFSALKHKGKALYTYARQGIEIERKAREVRIHDIELTDLSLPSVSFRTVCSKGTYIRTLCHDIGEKLGTGGHMQELERRAIGPFHIKNSLTFEELQSISEGEEIQRGIYTPDEALSWLPEFTIDEALVRSVIHGQPIKLNTLNLSDTMKKAAGIRIKSPEDTLLAIGSYLDVKNTIKLDVVFA